MASSSSFQFAGITPAMADADKENLTLPYTPTSTSSASPHQPQPHLQHRKANSLSSGGGRPASSKIASRTFSLREGQFTDEDLKALRGEDRDQEKKEEQREGVMITTPPENLPPSPPLTSQETDGDADVDPAEAAGVERMEATEEGEEEVDVVEGQQSRGKSTLEAVADDQHPLSAADVDLERGLEQTKPVSEEEADVTDQSTTAVAKFGVVRKPKRPVSLKPPRSSYYVGPPTGNTAFYTAPRGQIGVHHPREIVRVERDYDHGELVQFSSSYPLELQGRITPTQFLETINALNEGLIRAHSQLGACLDNTLAVLTLWLSPLVLESKYEREMRRLRQVVDRFNAEVYNPHGLNILWPRKSAFLFLEIEYY